MSLSFLSNISVAAATVKSSAPKGGPGAKKQRQPLTADLRVWKDGSIYPSAALIAEFDLEYRNKEAEDKGYGFDIANALGMSKQLQGVTQDFLLIGAVKRSEPKVDLFGTCNFDKESGEPTVGIAEQGAYSYGKAVLLPLLKATYGVEPNDEGYIDLSLSRVHAMQSPNGIFSVPKTITRGENAGKIDFQRREHQTFYPLVLVSQVQVEDTQVEGNATEKAEDVSTTTSVTEGAALAEGSMIHGTVSLDGAEKADPIDYSSAEYDHVVTQEDLDANAPDLEDAGVNVGDTIGIAEQEDPFLN